MGEFTQDTEVLVIGAGPGGYAAAFRAADLFSETEAEAAEIFLGGATHILSK